MEDIIIKYIGGMALNSVNGGSLIDWEPNNNLFLVLRPFFGQRLFECIKNQVIREEFIDDVRQHLTSYYNFTNSAFSSRPEHVHLD